MKLTMGLMKPFMYSFVEHGIEALKTPEMKLTIAGAFIKDGHYYKARNPAENAGPFARTLQNYDRRI